MEKWDHFVMQGYWFELVSNEEGERKVVQISIIQLFFQDNMVSSAFSKSLS